MTEEATLNSWKEKLKKMDVEIEDLLALPTSDEEMSVLENWSDRCLEYEMLIHEALRKLKH